MTKIPESEVLRYLGAPKSEDEALLAQVREVCAALEENVAPRALWREFPCRADESGVTVAGVPFGGADLARHLKGCGTVLLFAATLGVEADRMARAESVRSMARGSIVHAAGAAMIEQFCDDMQAKLGEKYEEKGLFLRPRYSPGYGDLPLAQQATFFTLLDLPKTLGLSLGDDLMMSPSKSVTAVIGISPEQKKSFRKCLHCGKTDCPFRREG